MGPGGGGHHRPEARHRGPGGRESEDLVSRQNAPLLDTFRDQDPAGDAAKCDGKSEQEGARQDSVPVIIRINPSRLTDPDPYH